jgi:hypothetical protein
LREVSGDENAERITRLAKVIPVRILKRTYSQVIIRLLGLRCKILESTEWRMGRLVHNELMVVLM